MLLDQITSMCFLEKTNGAAEPVEDFTEPKREPVLQLVHEEASGFFRKQGEVRVKYLWRILR